MDHDDIGPSETERSVTDPDRSLLDPEVEVGIEPPVPSDTHSYAPSESGGYIEGQPLSSKSGRRSLGMYRQGSRRSDVSDLTSEGDLSSVEEGEGLSTPRYRGLARHGSSLYHTVTTSKYWSRGSGGSRFRSTRSGASVGNFVDPGPKQILTLFEWTEGGQQVFVKGSWDNYRTMIPMENIGSGVHRVVIPVPEDHTEFKFVVDGEERVSKNYAVNSYRTGLSGETMDVNVRRVKEDRSTQRSNGASVISEVDVYSPTQIEEYHSPWLFRFLYLAMFPSALYYFYWLIERGGNRVAPVNWIMFFLAEVLSFFSAVISLFAMWAPVRRQWRSLDTLKPPLDTTLWPSVDIVLCHYREPVEQIQESVRAAMRMDYPSHLIRVIVADDGYFAKPKAIEHTELGEDLHSMLAFEAQHDPLMEELLQDNGRVEHYTVRCKEDIVRPDCAMETHIIDYGPYGADVFAEGARPRLSLIARVKPADHHNKAGNINNVLFNSGTDGKLILFLDSDMRPEPNFLKRTIPLMLRAKDEDDIARLVLKDSDLEHFYVGAKDKPSHWEIDTDVSFVQTPQRFHNASREDYLAVRNSIFYDAIGTGRDGFGLTPFAGTNCLWRREVLDELGGIIYGSVTEDTLTSNKCHASGYVSKYACEDLCWGEAPVTAAAAMLQRLRWAKGAVQNGIFAFRDLRRKDPAGNELKEFLSFRRQSRSPHNRFVRLMFWLDSTMYPVLGIGAYMYVFVAMYYLISAQPPISPESVATLAGAFVTYYTIRYLVFFAAYWGVSQTDLLRAMETWFTYVIPHLIGMYEALNPNSKLSWVQNTGEGIRKHWSEWVNIFIAFMLIIGIIFRLIAFLTIDGGCRPWNSFGALFFGGFALVMIWPMTSMSLNERISGAPASVRNNNGVEIPIAPAMAIFTIAGVLFLASWVDAPCGIQSKEVQTFADTLAGELQ
uniref:Glycosyltransferase 2-like domain-containing protein n=1 Tax=Compsopogon caeruleus TaxID=31354 RepID=A0A7S1TAI6_9RHOD|mmetsp:Transcript_14313/g.29333  ORF Transcript_14313/g.29333 Transcript_14313/m.29333 type:complete len:943 (+) Transcript_14313:137-2965(+)|eukprot:CAMPEP_0184686038 /NCGR_PEP_ID=MMETSP0312-20130426/21097_1 /TAXON_ID=31354 /ORGANISM="Compsopogon coeruleus, Strain SAG 36.94" /LENGTH=942 /DNA_ID=CAMNT_0027140733 /DNA_START=118 /DNA_END=2946 /DNA_ORIENTATION=+